MFQDRDIIIEKYQIYQRYSYQYKEKIDGPYNNELQKLSF